MLSDVSLSVAYIGPGRHRKTKSGTEVAHVTHDSDTTFKVQRSRSPSRLTHCGFYASGSCSGDRGNVFTVGTYYVAVRRCRREALRRPQREDIGRGHCGGSRTSLILFRLQCLRSNCSRTAVESKSNHTNRQVGTPTQLVIAGCRYGNGAIFWCEHDIVLVV